MREARGTRDGGLCSDEGMGTVRRGALVSTVTRGAQQRTNSSWPSMSTSSSSRRHDTLTMAPAIAVTPGLRRCGSPQMSSAWLSLKFKVPENSNFPYVMHDSLWSVGKGSVPIMST